VACWGNNNSGQLGDGTTINSNVPAVIAGLNNVVSLAAFGYSTCAAKADGTVWCWGFQGYGGANFANLLSTSTPQQMSGLTDVVALAGGDNSTGGGTHACALQRSGTVQCWGNNDLGELGRGGPITAGSHVPSLLIPQPVVGLSDAVSIAASGGSTCAIKADGTVVCWGYGGVNLVNLGVNRPSSTVFQVSSPIPVTGVTNAVSLAMSHFGMACAVINDGTMKCWGVGGTNHSGLALAQTSTTAMGALPTTLTGIGNVAALTLGLAHTCALKTDATVECWGTYGFRSNYNTAEPQATPLAIKDASGAPITNVQAVSSGMDHTCASKFDGTVHCWGWNGSGQLGDSSNVGHLTAQPVTLTGLNKAAEKLSSKALAVGNDTSCVIKTNGEVACWGLGNYGQLGNGANSNSRTPVPVNLQGNFTAVTTSASTGGHACALKDTGDVFCWGLGSYGQLGNGQSTNSNVPVSVNILGGASAISAGGTHTCALKNDGNIACWGNFYSGQLGVMTQTPEVPNTVIIPGGAIALSAGNAHTCAVKTNGDVACWGRNYSGQVGKSGYQDTEPSPVITVISGGAKAVTAGAEHTCATKNDNSVVCWGGTSVGSLGNAQNNFYSYSPVAVSLSGGVKVIDTRSFHNCAVKSSTAEVVCWGQGSQGELGNGVSVNSNVPVTASLPSAAITAAAGSGHSCAILVNGDVYCWGQQGTTGALGNGTTSNSNFPVKVVGLPSLARQLSFWK
jgi:alpha-tubulin suppressor-like RCC1 family protein